jgi:hypothetical protein
MVDLRPSSTSYWSAPEQALDPNLFSGTHVLPEVRTSLLRQLYGYWDRRYRNPEGWSTVWIAGSGASYQWSAARDPGDLDVLIGVDYGRFRRANPGYAGLSDEEISGNFNDEFRADLDPKTEHFPIGSARFEVTWFVNPHATDIRSIHPYAAYDLSHDEWTVPPDPTMQAPSSTEWDARAQQDLTAARDILDRYNRAHALLAVADDPGHRLNVAVELRAALNAGAKLFDDIHSGRHAAFDEDGQGYNDYANFRWQASNRNGVVPAMRDLKAERGSLYGEAPVEADKLLIEAALYRRNR